MMVHAPVAATVGVTPTFVVAPPGKVEPYGANFGAPGKVTVVMAGMAVTLVSAYAVA